MARLENWAICISGDGYSAPEMRRQYATGLVYGHDGFPDGSDIQTSTITAIHFDRGYVQTLNTRYDLGVVSPAYLQHCENINHKNVELVRKFRRQEARHEA